MLVSIVSCEQTLIEINDTPVTNDVSLIADPPVWGIEGTGIAPLTKTARLEDGRTVWTNYDAINVFQGTMSNSRFQLSSVNDDGQAIFSGTLDVVTGIADGANQSLDFWAVYPYSEDNVCFGNGVSLTVKDRLTGVAGTFGNGDFPAIGTGPNLAIGFYNICSGLVLSFSQPNIIAVIVEGTNHETLAGKVNIVFDEDGKPVVSGILEGKDVVTLNAPDMYGFVPGNDYFIPILPTEFSNGFKLTFIKATYSIVTDEIKYYKAEYSITRAVSVRRSIFGRVEGFDTGLSFQDFNYVKEDYSEEETAADLASVYDSFMRKVASRGSSALFSPMRVVFNMCGDDVYAAGCCFGDNDFLGSLNEFRYDDSNEAVRNVYEDFYSVISDFNRIIDKYRGCQSDLSRRVIAETRVLRAYVYMQLVSGWGTPPFVYLYDSSNSIKPYNSDRDPVCPRTHKQFLEWCARECEKALIDLDERTSPTDVEGAYTVTIGFANAVAGKAYLFAEDYSKSRTALSRVIESGKYDLVPGERYWELFHIEGDGNEEKVFEPSLVYNPSIGAWSGPNQMSTWMEANLFNWRSDHFKYPPHQKYSGVDGWGSLGVPQWFGDEFFANDGHSYRFDATLKHIDDAVYGMEYSDAVVDGGKKVNDMTLDEKKASKAIGIADSKDGLYGQSFWLPFKQLVKSTDCGPYGNNVRLNNYTIMRYAEVLLLYAEACLQSGDSAQGAWAVNQIRQRAGLSTLGNVDMNVLKKEKSYEFWFEGCRWTDILRWGDLERVSNAGSNIPKLFDKLFRAPKASDNNITWENGSEENSRFYTVSSHEAIDRGDEVGFKANKHEWFPYPNNVLDTNPNLVQNPGW